MALIAGETAMEGMEATGMAPRILVKTHKMITSFISFNTIGWIGAVIGVILCFILVGLKYYSYGIFFGFGLAWGFGAKLIQDFD